jgi:phospholipid/cholesterol/gamma-HCH transport system permease protein
MYKESSNQNLVQLKAAEFNQQDDLITLSGSWLWSTINEKYFNKQLAQIQHIKAVKIDGLTLDNIDTTGIYFIVRLVKYLEKQGIALAQLELNPSDAKLYERINTQLNAVTNKPATLRDSTSLLSSIGKSFFDGFNSALALLNFFGLFCFNLLRFFRSPQNLDWREVSRTINDAGIKGLWVASLLSLLLGITLAYQMAPQFTTYGANVYIVNFLGIAMLKEVSPLMTAVIVAGRTGAAITAEIGTQKVQEEIDALQTMGISTMQRVVLPKIIGVMIAVPLITSIADMASMLGGAIVSNASLGVNYTLFLYRMQSYVSINNYACGIVKSFAFAFIVALVGCFCGLKVKGNANSIGQETTKSVVTGIILIVVIDAIFGIIFKNLGV